jgi:multidrug efflux pump subunit AcrA (membrane-fusion protein)
VNTRSLSFRLAALAAVTLTVILLARAWQGRAPRAAAALQRAVVAVARVQREDLFKEITIPAEFRPYTEVELHAKVSGYVKEMKVDIGDRVKAGQLLAVLEVPELHDDFDHAVASHARAQADYHMMRISRISAGCGQ